MWKNFVDSGFVKYALQNRLLVSRNNYRMEFSILVHCVRRWTSWVHIIWWWLFCYLPSRLRKQTKQSVQKGPWFFEIWLNWPPNGENPSILIYYKTSINSLDKMRYVFEFQIELKVKLVSLELLRWLHVYSGRLGVIVVDLCYFAHYQND